MENLTKENRVIEITEVYELKTNLFREFCIKEVQEKHRK